MKKILTITAICMLLLTGCGGKGRAITKAISTNDHVSIDEKITSDNVNRYVRRNMTALMYAIYSGASMQTIQEIINKGANINFANKKHHDAIYYSIVYDRIDVLKYLVSLGAKPTLSLEFLKDIAEKKGLTHMHEYLQSLKF
ncbi:hypothetical protein LMG7974_00165 [Campylobacter majalis]|uniref:Ankyrin repeat domain-containing protein n=1 Tax=Campylobacter majalis TaxID=2790656 RepID=A0ABM8Q281_9BACT|nr:ankyrin repeat domain-containing protein [Campylobacter majalis]CAD7286950.1 hypothetical protein LMG7974_00165 [Campylobacter majalis]